MVRSVEPRNRERHRCDEYDAIWRVDVRRFSLIEDVKSNQVWYAFGVRIHVVLMTRKTIHP